MMRTSNPTLNDKVFSNSMVVSGGEVMTIEGTINKTFVALAITMAAAYVSWINPAVAAFAIPAAIVGLIVGIVGAFKQSWAPAITPIYAAVEGVFLGAISRMFEAQYEGLVNQAILLTLGVAVCMLLTYRSGMIKVTNKFRLGVAAATGAIFFFYLIQMILGFLGMGFGSLHASTSLFSIGFSVVVIAVAALNLVLDFDMIEKAAESGQAAKYMEWYGAFALLVTLVWLYLEILRFLAKLRDR